LKIGVISDTHGVLEKRVTDFLSDCDEIWHAGDVGNSEIIDTLNTIAPTRGVYGNIDGNDIRSVFPENIIFSVQSQKVIITHIAGNPPRYNPRVKKLINDHHPDIFVCGHSHILKVMFDKANNLLYINPGALGNQGFHKKKTAVRFQLSNGKPIKMEVLDYGRHKKKDPYP